MSEQKFAEFRERAELAVTPTDPDQLLERGGALRRRRRLAPLVAAVAVAAVGYGVLTVGGDDDARTDVPPVAPPSTPAPRWLEENLTAAPGVYDMDYVTDGVPDASFEVFGGGWNSFSGGVYKWDSTSAVSMGLGLYSDIPVERCATDRRAESLGGAVRQLSGIPGRVLAGPRAETAAGVAGTHLRLSLPVEVECPDGAAPAPGNLQAIWDGPTDPTVTVDVWLIEHDDRLLLLTKGVRGRPSEDTLVQLNRTMDSLRLQPADEPAR